MKIRTPKDPRPEPSPKYRELAEAARSAGMDVADDDFEQMDDWQETSEEN